MSPQRITFEGDAVAACPACDNAPVWRREGCPQGTSPEHEFACYECDWRGDDYLERDSRHNQHMEGNVKPRGGTLAAKLAEAEPGDFITDGGVVQERDELDPVNTDPDRLEGCWLRRERNGSVLIGEIYTVRTMNGERWINFLVATRDEGKRGVTCFPEREREDVTVVENRTAFEPEGIGRGP